MRSTKPRNYLLDAGDVLGVFVEGALGNFDEAPPVQLPQPGSDLPPAIGYPVPVREDGTLSLPLVDPIPVKGLTVQQAEQLIRRAYRQGDEPVLREGRVIVTLFRERTYRVFVVRQDNTCLTTLTSGLKRGEVAEGFLTVPTLAVEASSCSFLHTKTTY